jgi:hypothetical protein
MKKLSLQNVLSILDEEENKYIFNKDEIGARYGVILGSAPIVEQGDFLREIGLGGLAVAFLKSINDFTKDLKIAEPYRHLIAEAAFAFANELVDLIHERGETVEDTYPKHLHLIDQAVMYSGVRFIGHISGRIEWMHSQIRLSRISQPEASDAVFLTWLKRPIPISSIKQTICA